MSEPRSTTVETLDKGQLVLLTGVGLIVAHLLFRGWASLNGWFYTDDLHFLADFTDRPLSFALLWEPHDSQFMPGGLLDAWLVAHAGTYQWAAAAVSMTLFQLVADVACLWMLLSLFGRRWSSIVLLGFYLFCTMTLTAFMWWAAGLNQVPTHAAFFACVALHVRYLRTGRVRWLAAAMLAIVIGECFYVKAALFVLPLAVLTLVWFVPTGKGWLRRAARLHGRAALAYAALTVAFGILYVRHVPNPLSSGDIHWVDLAEAMFGRSLSAVLLGGPWHWTWAVDPAGQVGTPPVVSALCWVLIIGVVVWLRVRRRATLWAIAVVLPYVAVTYYLTARGRGMLGGFVGVELRYLADAAPVFTLAAGLLVLPLIGATRQPLGASQGPPLPRTRGGRIALTGVALLAAAGCAWSNATYVVGWHEFPQRSYMAHAISAAERSPLRLLDIAAPESVFPAVDHPYNLPGEFLRPLGERAQVLTAGTDLQVLREDGRPGTLITAADGAASTPGPVAGCGHPVSGTELAIDTTGSPQDFFWHAVVRYLAKADGTVSLTIGDDHVEMPVLEGAHTYVFDGSGAFAGVTATGTADNVVCIDAITVGDVAALEDQ